MVSAGGTNSISEEEKNTEVFAIKKVSNHNLSKTFLSKNEHGKAKIFLILPIKG